MPTIALNISLVGKKVVIVGGGQVALRKCRVLLATEADIHLVAPEFCPELRDMVEAEHLTVRMGRFQTDDLAQAFMVIAATNDRAVNQAVATLARQQGILVNVTDLPEEGDCCFPAMLRRGPLEIAVSTGGGSPGLAAGIRDIIAGTIGDEYAAIVRHVAAEREKLLTEQNDSTYNTQVLRSLTTTLLAELTGRKETIP